MSAAPNSVNGNGPPEPAGEGAVRMAYTPGPLGPPGPPGPPATVVYMPVMSPPTNYDYCENYRSRQSIGVGACQMMFGILCIIFNGIGLGFGWRYSSDLYIGHGFWSGVLFIVTGALGISAGQTRTRCKITGFLSTCILSACCAAPLLAISVIGAVMTTPRTYNCNPYSGYYTYYYYSTCADTYGYRVVIAMEALMALTAIVEALLAIWGSAISCRVVCCCNPVTTQGVIVPANYLSGNGQMVYVNQTQGASYIYNPVPPNANGQGPLGPPSYQASFAQAAWTQPQPQPHPIQAPLFYPSAPTYERSELPSYQGNRQNQLAGEDPPKY